MLKECSIPRLVFTIPQLAAGTARVVTFGAILIGMQYCRMIHNLPQKLMEPQRYGCPDCLTAAKLMPIPQIKTISLFTFHNFF